MTAQQQNFRLKLNLLTTRHDFARNHLNFKETFKQMMLSPFFMENKKYLISKQDSCYSLSFDLTEVIIEEN